MSQIKQGPIVEDPPAQITLPQRVVFLHIAKTAGTSIVRFFRQRLPRRETTSHGDFMELSGSHEERVRQLGRYRFVSGHFGYSDVAPLLPDSYSFTFLRDPVDRVLSLYKFFLWPAAQERIPAAKLALEMGMDGFFTSDHPLVQEMLDNQQTWQLARSYWQEDRAALAHLRGEELLGLAKEHLDGFDLVGTTETFDGDFIQVLKTLSIEEEVPQMKHFRTPKPISSDELSPETLAVLRERMALDYALLGHVRRQRAQDPV